jgi:hypothetical protein
MPISAEQVENLATQLTVAGNQRAGVSIDLNLGRILTGVGFCVGYAATQGNEGRHGLEQSMIHANGPNGSGIIGAWRQGQRIFYDSVKKYSTRTAAVQAAQKEGQICIYNLMTNDYEYIMIKGAGFNARSPGSFLPSVVTGRQGSHDI